MAKPKASPAPRPLTVADAHALADRMERLNALKSLGPGSDTAMAAQLIRALLRGRKAHEVINMEE